MNRLRRGLVCHHRPALNYFVLFLGVTTLVAATLAGCSEDNSGGTNPTPSLPTAITVTTAGNNFVSVRNGSQPAVDTLQVGGSMTWTGLGSGLHLVASDGPTVFTSQTTGASTYGPITLLSAGTYDYHCSVHGASMHGTVEVVP